MTKVRINIGQCCNPQIKGGGGWGIFNALFGWQNSATVGSVVSYNLYWIAVMIAFFLMRYNEKKGHWPFLKAKAEKSRQDSEGEFSSGEDSDITNPEKSLARDGGVSEVRSTKS